VIKIADISMDSIDIEISGSTENATKGIVTLEKALTNLNSKLTGVQNNIGKYLNSMKNVGNVFKRIKLPSISDAFGKSTNGKMQNPLQNMNMDNGDKGGKDNDGKKAKQNISTVNTLMGQLSKTTAATMRKIKQMLSYLGKVVILKAGLKGLNTIFGNIGNKVNTLAGNLRSTIKSLSKYALALYGIRSAFYAVRNTANEFLSSQDAVAKQLSTNISYLKFSIGSMFAPIIEYITNLIYKLLQVIQYLVYYFSKVNIFAGKTAQSYANMGTSAAKTTKELNKQLQAFDELNNINFNKDNTGSGGAGTVTPSFDLSQINEDLKPKFDDIELLFEELAEKINKKLASINWDSIQKKATDAARKAANALNRFTDKLDFKLIGYTVAQGFNTVFKTVNTFLDTYKFDRLGEKLGDGLNELVKRIDWEELGKFLVQGFRIAIETLYGFLNKFDFGELGNGIGRAINAGFASIKWDHVGQVLYKGAVGILDTFIHIFDTVQFDVIGRDIGTALAQIRWDEVFTKVSTAITKAFSGLGKLFKGIFEQFNISDFIHGVTTGFNQLVSDTKTTIENLDFKEVGTTLARTLNQLISEIDWGELAATLGQALLGVLDTAIGFLNEFDFGELGGKIIDILMSINWLEVAEKIGEILISITNTPFDILMGMLKETFEKLPEKIPELLQSLPETLGTFLGKVGETVLNNFTKPWELLGTILEGFFKTAWELIQKAWENPGEFFSGIWEGIKKIFEPVGNVLGGFFQTAWDAIQGVWSAVSGFFSGSFEGITKIFEPVGNVLGGFFSGAWEGIKKAWDGTGKFFSGAWEGIKKVFEPVGDVLGKFFSGAWEGIKKAWDGTGKFFSDVWGGIQGAFSHVSNWFKDVFSKAWQGVKDVFSTGGKIFEGIKDGIGKTLKAVINAIIKGINVVIAVPFNVINGILTGIKSINIFGITPFDWINTIPVPQIPTFAEGGFPNEGQFFIAREDGPEMVGSIGNKTAVANNDQITKAIADATYLAVSQAIKDSSENDGQPLNIYIGNEKVYRGYTKYQNQLNNQYGLMV
jgi:phage-related protein